MHGQRGGVRQLLGLFLQRWGAALPRLMKQSKLNTKQYRLGGCGMPCERRTQVPCIRTCACVGLPMTLRFPGRAGSQCMHQKASR